MRFQRKRYFEAYFPEAFEALGALIFGHFVDREQADRFTWIRGFPDMAARKTVNAAFYGGPLWKEHSTTMNDRLVDHTDVLLLQPLDPAKGVLILPAVDPIAEPEGAQGIAVVQIFAVVPHAVEALAAKDNFPSLPFRTDGPYLVWLGIVPNEEALRTFQDIAQRAGADLQATGFLRATPEVAVLDPAPRSRLRWVE